MATVTNSCKYCNQIATGQITQLDSCSSFCKHNTVDSGYKGMLNRGNSGYRGQFVADQKFYLVKAGQIEEKGAF